MSFKATQALPITFFLLITLVFLVQEMQHPIAISLHLRRTYRVNLLFPTRAFLAQTNWCDNLYLLVVQILDGHLLMQMSVHNLDQSQCRLIEWVLLCRQQDTYLQIMHTQSHHQGM
jgi:hypothetical protein